MANTSPSNRPRLLLFLDWDGTLTPTSTLPLIASIATSPAPHPTLAALSAAYAHDLTTHDGTYTPPKRDRTTVPQELAYLDSLRPVERASIERVEAAGLFRGVGTREVDGVAKAVVADGGVRLREGVAELVRKVGGRGGGGGVAIVSVAWSRRFIRGVLGGSMRSYDDDDGGGGGWGSTTDSGKVLVEGVVVDVRANEIAGDGSGMLDRVFGGCSCSSGGGGGIWTAGDKVRVMNDIVLEAENGNGNGNEAMVPKTIYIGDSPTDLACLLQAHVGICIRDAVSLSAEQRDLQETLQRIGVPCLHIGRFEQRRFEIDEQAQQHFGGTMRLWWAGDFEEVWRSGVLE